jgi:hypothetical protein
VERVLSRSEIIDVLRQWQAGVLTPKQVHDWASELYFPFALDYEDEEDEESVAREVMHELDSLDINLVMVDDVPNYLEFLATPRGQYEEGHRKFRLAQEQIYQPERLQERRRRLAHDPFYAWFCKE